MVTNILTENRKTSGPVRVVASIAIVLAFVGVIAPASGQVRGAYSPGSTLTGAGTLPDPGFSYSNQFWYNSSHRLTGPQGKPIPIQGTVVVLADNSSVTYVPKFKMLGANLAFMVVIALANGRFAARNPFTGRPGVSGSGAGLTNTNFVPFELGWHLKWADIQAGYSVYAPTGRFVPDAMNNVSSGFWTNGGQAGATVYLTKNKATQLSIYNYYACNTVQQGTGVQPGQNDSLDYSLSENVPLDQGGKWSLQIGAAGYGQWQTTNNASHNPVPALRYGVNAAGVTTNLFTPFKALTVGISALWEYGAKNTYEGRTMTITAGFNF